MSTGKSPADQDIKKTSHHVITRKFIRDHNLRLKRGYKRPIPDYLHVSYHTVFGGTCSWVAVKHLKIWSKQIKQKERPFFFESFTPKQLRAFEVLFGFEPVELGNGCLTKAIRFLQDSGYFYPTPASMSDFKKKIKKNKK